MEIESRLVQKGGLTIQAAKECVKPLTDLHMKKNNKQKIKQLY